ncbi:hypothetical protein CBS101457_006956 [Exobasidium rhododendri]|nr:hypothetical protein CBS101457_006956 [Exobasidium rhododendri]
MTGAKIAIIIHSVWGHVAELAFQAEEGAAASGAEVTVFQASICLQRKAYAALFATNTYCYSSPQQVAESFSEEVLGKMHADKSRTDSLPVLDPKHLANYDGFIFAFATRFGRAPAQISALFDRTGGLWAQKALQGKFSAIITSTGSQHGGLETTALTTLPFFIHHGINVRRLAQNQFEELSELSEVIGASPYSAGTVAGGDNSRRPSAKELHVAKEQGRYFAGVVNQYVRGKQ